MTQEHAEALRKGPARPLKPLILNTLRNSPRGSVAIVESLLFRAVPTSCSLPCCRKRAPRFRPFNVVLIYLNRPLIQLHCAADVLLMLFAGVLWLDPKGYGIGKSEESNGFRWLRGSFTKHVL